MRVRKPEVRPAGIDVEYAAVTVERRVTRAYVGLGANLGDREARSARAAELIGAQRLSTIRETEPWGVTDQPPFLNAVAEVETVDSARASCSTDCSGSSASSGACATARAGGRGRSTSICSSTARRRSTSRV